MCAKTVSHVLGSILSLSVRAVTSQASEDFKETELDETGRAALFTLVGGTFWARLTWQLLAAGRVLELGGGLKPPSLAMVQSLCTGCSCTAEQAYQTFFPFAAKALYSPAEAKLPRMFQQIAFYRLRGCVVALHADQAAEGAVRFAVETLFDIFGPKLAGPTQS